MTAESGDDQRLQRALERVWARVGAEHGSGPRLGASSDPEDSSHQPVSASTALGEVESERAKIRLAFGFFVLIVGIFVFLFGMMRHDKDVTEGTIIMLLSTVPFLGGTWHVHQALQQLKARAKKLEDDLKIALGKSAGSAVGVERPR